VTVEENLREGRRNLYRLQMGGNALCEALRKIADGCDNPQEVARRALHNKAPDPKWSDIPGMS
jgi:hypothetical protein